MRGGGIGGYTFWIALLVFTGILFVLVHQQVLSFGFFSSWTAQQQIRLDRGSQISMDLDRVTDRASEDLSMLGGALAQIKVSQGTIYRGTLLSQGVARLSSSDALLSIDIIDMLDGVSDRRSVLRAYEQRVLVDIQEHELVWERLHYMAQDLLYEAQVCQQDKTNADRRFFGGVHDRHLLDTEQGLAQSIQAGRCATEKRIEGLAYDYLAQYVRLHRQLLQRRATILERHGDLIIDHYPYLQGDILSQLVEVRRQLESLRAVPYQQVHSYFSWWVPSQPRPPVLFNVRFRTVQPPNYLYSGFE